MVTNILRGVVGCGLLSFVTVAGVALAGAPPSERVDGARLMATLREIPTSRSALGDASGVEGLVKTEAWVESSLRAMGYTPTLEPIWWAVPARDWPGQKKEDLAEGASPRVWNNVIVEIVGRELPGEVLIVGAHFDAVPRSPGADDNGTGTAALMELALVLRDVPMKRTVRFVFFNLEEVGLVGSRQNAENVRVRREKNRKERADRKEVNSKGTKGTKVENEGDEAIVGMVSLEMLGFFTDAPNSQRSPIKAIEGVFVPPTVGDFISIVTVAAHQRFSKQLADGMISATTDADGNPGLKVTRVDFSPVPMPDMLRSDHAPYLALNIPAVMLTDTANFRNPNYHKPSDTVETIDTERFTLVVKGLAGAVVEIAGASER